MQRNRRPDSTALQPSTWMQMAAALALGAAFTVPLAHTWAWPLALACLVVLVMLLQDVSPRRAACIGWLFGSAWIGASTWWLFVSLHYYGNLVAPVAVLAVAVLALALGVFLAVAMFVFARFKRASHPWRNAVLFALVWFLAEVARARIYSGFPWGAAGYTQIDAPLVAWAPWVGVYGVGALLALAAAVVALLTNPWWQRAAVVVVLMGVPWLSPSFTTPTSTITVTMIQTNIAQDDKFDPTKLPRHVWELIDAVRHAKSQLVLAPETAIPVLPSELGPDGFTPFEAPFADERGGLTNPDRGALIGLPMGSFDAGYTNSVVGFGGAPVPGGGRYRYNKHHLVPFGEIIPPGFRWFVDIMKIPLGDFERGPVVAPSFVVAGERIGPNICYEDLFGEELAQRYGPGGDAPTIHANVSNIAWFGNTVAIDHHLNISRMRALELQRPMVRATNTGATAAINHLGEVTAALTRHTRRVLHTTVQGREGLTPYVRLMVATGGLGTLAWMAMVAVAMLGLSRCGFHAPREGL